MNGFDLVKCWPDKISASNHGYTYWYLKKNSRVQNLFRGIR